VRVGVLNNLKAGRNRKQVSRVLDVLRRYPDVAHVETESVRDLPEALVELTRREVDLLVVNGGDGTLQYVLTELLASSDLPSLRFVAPLRGGRTNMTASDLGADPRPGRGLVSLLDALAAGRLDDRLVARPVLRVASSRRSGVQYGMFFGAGMIQRAVSLVHRTFPPGQQGVFGAGIVTGALITRAFTNPSDGILTPDKAVVHVDGHALRHSEFYLLIASTLSHLFLGMRPFWGEGPGGVRLTGISSRPHRSILAAPGILRGRPRAFVTPENGYESANSHRAQIAMGCGFTIDGEIFAPEPDEQVELSADRRLAFVRA
jgi:diacylglycerol kinase-like protein